MISNRAEQSRVESGGRVESRTEIERDLQREECHKYSHSLTLSLSLSLSQPHPEPGTVDVVGRQRESSNARPHWD